MRVSERSIGAGEAAHNWALALFILIEWIDMQKCNHHAYSDRNQQSSIVGSSNIPTQSQVYDYNTPHIPTVSSSFNLSHLYCITSPKFYAAHWDIGSGLTQIPKEGPHYLWCLCCINLPMCSVFNVMGDKVPFMPTRTIECRSYCVVSRLLRSQLHTKMMLSSVYVLPILAANSKR